MASGQESWDEIMRQLGVEDPGEPDQDPESAGLDFDQPKKTKLPRSVTVTVRLDPRLRYLAEVAGRRQRRTVSSFIEWAVENSLKHVHMAEMPGGQAVTLSDAAPFLWDVDECDRFAKLALRHPDLLTHEEQRLWKLIREYGYIWRGGYDPATKEWKWATDEPSLIFERLRELWDTFTAIAKGTLTVAALPEWAKTEPKKK